METDPNVHNLNALLIGTGEFHFAEGATLATAGKPGFGFKSFDNVKAFQLAPEKESKEHIGSYRGVKRRDKTFNISAKFSYKLTLDTVGLQKLLLMFFGIAATPFTQSALTTSAGDALNFTTANSVKGEWYDLRVAGARVRNITAAVFTVSSTPLVENTDYVLDATLGRVRFITTQTGSVTFTVSAPAVNSSSANYLKALTPLGKATRSGIARLTCYDQNEPNQVVFDHVDFGCEVNVSNQADVNGDDVSSYEVTVNLTDPVGTVFVRED